VKFSSRRFLGTALRVVGRAWEDVAQEVQEWSEKMQLAWQGGIPPGFNSVIPTIIQAGIPGSAGSESVGWMAADASIPIETGVPIGLSNNNADGTGTSLMRSSAHIKRDVRVFVNGIELATRNSLDIVGLIVTDNPVSDRIKVSLPAADASDVSMSAQEVADLELRSVLDSLALRDLIAKNYHF
jgi:hypothetical protein